MSGLKQKAKTLKVGVVPWQLWIKSPAYLRLTPEKKIKSLLTIIERKEEEIAKLKDEFVIVKAQRDGFDSMHGELEERLGQIREHTKNFEHDFSEFAKWFAEKYGKYASADEIIIQIGLLKEKLEELMRL